MLKRSIRWALFGTVIALLAGALQSMRAPIIFREGWQGGNPTVAKIDRGRLVLKYSRVLSKVSDSRRQVRFLGFAYRADPVFGGPRGMMRRERVSITLSLWTPILLLSTYPVASLIAVPMRRASRRARNLCFNCAYSLVGNESGVCPECGEACAAWCVPTWKRIAIAFLCALIVAWILEFVTERSALEHRLAIWMLRRLGLEGGSWLIISALRTVASVPVCLLVYIFLSPERFHDNE